MAVTWTPPIIPERKPGWEHGYVDVLNRHAAAPFDWHLSDCLKMVADMCLALTGVDPMAGLRIYDSAEGAAQLMQELGCRDVKQALHRVFKRIPKAHAHRGDCGVVETLVDGQPALGAVIFTGELVLGKAVGQSSIYLPRSAVLAAFAIGARQ